LPLFKKIRANFALKLRKELLTKCSIISTAEEKQIIFTSFVRRGKDNKKKKNSGNREHSWIFFGKFLDFQKN